MKMLYLLLKIPKSLRPLVLLAVFGTVVCGMIFLDIRIPHTLRNTVAHIATPFWHVRATLVGERNLRGEERRSLADLTAEREVLYEELATARREAYMTELLKEENDALRALIGRAEPGAGRIPAAVLLTADDTPRALFMIDAGAPQGVRDNMLVTTPEGIALGSVTAVYDAHSVVRLFSGAGVETPVVLVTGSSTLHATLTGWGEGMRMRIPRDEVVAVNSAVTVPTFSGALIGTVVAIDKLPEDAFQTVYVASPENIYHVRYVLVDTTALWTAPAHTVPADDTNGGEDATPDEY